MVIVLATAVAVVLRSQVNNSSPELQPHGKHYVSSMHVDVCGTVG